MAEDAASVNKLCHGPVEPCPFSLGLGGSCTQGPKEVRVGSPIARGITEDSLDTLEFTCG